MAAGPTLVHRTTYTYERPAHLGPQLVRLRPRPHPRQPAAPYALTVTPTPLSLHWQTDPWENHIARLVLPQPLETLVLQAELTLDLTPRNPYDFLLEPGAETWPFRYDPALADALSPYRGAEYPGAAMQALAAATGTPTPTVDFVRGLAGTIRDRLDYITRDEPGVWPPDHTLAAGRASCRDSAWVLVQLMRMHGLAARFVSGYLVHRPEDGGAPSAELHAWAEAFLPGAGWIGIDPTSGFLAAEDHIALAASPTPEGAAPLTGTVEPVAVHFSASVEIHP